MGHEFVDQMMERNRAGELRSPVSETLDMELVEGARRSMKWPRAPSWGTRLG